MDTSASVSESRKYRNPENKNGKNNDFKISKITKWRNAFYMILHPSSWFLLMNFDFVNVEK